jgi:hypothetical protein
MSGETSESIWMDIDPIRHRPVTDLRSFDQTTYTRAGKIPAQKVGKSEKSQCSVGKRVFPRLLMTIPTVETDGKFGPNTTIFEVVPKW